MMEDNKSRKEEVYSKRIKAGKRTYFFDVKETKGNDFYVTITESKRKLDGDGYSKFKIFLYKEDFIKFISGLTDVVCYVKENLIPGLDFEKYHSEQLESVEAEGQVKE